MNFDRSTAVEYWSPDSSPIRHARGRRWVLWPALAFLVEAYQPRTRALNLFQEFALKLCKCGARTPEVIGDRLGLGRSIAKVILKQLRANGLVDEDSMPTRMGLKLIEGDREVEPVPITGRVYWNPFSGTLWPRFTTVSPGRFDILSVRPGPGGGSFKVRFEAAKAGRPDGGEAIAIIPRPGWQERIETPTTQLILAACRKMRLQQQDYRRYGRLIGKHKGGAGPLLADELGPIEEVSLISRRPEPVFLATYLFVPEEIERGSGWQACDPFGFGPSPSLRRQIAGLIDRDEGKILRQLIEELTHQAYSVEQADLAELLGRQHQLASKAVLARLGPEIGSYEELYHLLIATEDALVEARLHANPRAQGFRMAQARLKDVMGRVYAALEELCAIVQRQYPASGTIAAFSSDVESNSEMLGRIAREKLGFVDDPDAPRLPGFLRVGQAEIVGIVDYNRHNLRSQLAVLISAANDQPEHPLYRLAREFPGALIELLGVKRLRDGASHAGRGALPVEEVARALDVAYRCVSGLLPGLAPSAVGEVGEGGGAGSGPERWQVALLHRLRAQATRRVEEAVGVALRELPTLHALLVEMQDRAVELELMADRVGDHLNFEGKLVSFSVKAGAALEEALGRLLLVHPRAEGEVPPETLDPAGDRAAKGRNAVLFSEIAEDLGFDVPEGGLPDVLTHVPADRVWKTLNERRGTLNSLTLALLLEAQGSGRHPMKALASTRPDLLAIVAEVSERRGHGDKNRVEAREAPRLAGAVLDVVKDLVDFLA